MELAEKIIRMLDAGMMPPAGIPRPDATSQKAFVASLESAIDQATLRDPDGFDLQISPPEMGKL